jgi:hypothetical protein
MIDIDKRVYPCAHANGLTFPFGIQVNLDKKAAMLQSITNTVNSGGRKGCQDMLLSTPTAAKAADGPPKGKQSSGSRKRKRHGSENASQPEGKRPSKGCAPREWQCFACMCAHNARFIQEEWHLHETTCRTA